MDVTGWGKFLVLLGSALGLVAYRFWHRCLLCDPEFAAGRFYHGLCLRIKLHAGVADRAVVIAQHGNGSLCARFTLKLELLNESNSRAPYHGNGLCSRCPLRGGPETMDSPRILRLRQPKILIARAAPRGSFRRKGGGGISVQGTTQPFGRDY